MEVPVGWYPNDRQRKTLGKYIYKAICSEGYDIPEAVTAIGNKIIERDDGDF